MTSICKECIWGEPLLVLYLCTFHAETKKAEDSCGDWKCKELWTNVHKEEDRDD